MLTIKLAEKIDYDDWCRLYNMYLDFYATNLSREQLKQVWDWFFNAEKQIHCYLAVNEKQIIGLAHFREFLRPIKANTGIFMDDLFVMPEYRGQGAAQKLIGAIKQYAIYNNIDIIRWITAKDNIKAINVYDKLASQTKWATYDLGID